jgi:hypothetical protein
MPHAVRTPKWEVESDTAMAISGKAIVDPDPGDGALDG